MFRFLKSLLTWALFFFGAVVIVALAVQWWPVEKPAAQTLKFNHESCEYSVELSPREWDVKPYIVDTYAPVKSGRTPEAYLHFLANWSFGHLYDPAVCTRTGDGDGHGQTADGLRVHYETVQCRPEKQTVFSGPPGQYRLYGTLEGRGISLGAGLYADNKEALEKYRSQLVAVMATLKLQTCKSDLAFVR